MTSDEIKQAITTKSKVSSTEVFWLREIAYQLAIANERNEKLDALTEPSDYVKKEKRYVEYCTREWGHTEPCNGLPREVDGIRCDAVFKNKPFDSTKLFQLINSKYPGVVSSFKFHQNGSGIGIDTIQVYFRSLMNKKINQAAVDLIKENCPARIDIQIMS